MCWRCKVGINESDRTVLEAVFIQMGRHNQGQGKAKSLRGGNIVYKDFVATCALLLSNDVEGKLRFAFQLYDKRGVGRVSPYCNTLTAHKGGFGCDACCECVIGLILTYFTLAHAGCWLSPAHQIHRDDLESVLLKMGECASWFGDRSLRPEVG